MFSKVPEPEGERDRKVILEICCNIGISAVEKGLYDLASEWLERAVRSNDLLSSGFRSGDPNMKLLALHTLGKPATLKCTQSMYPTIFSGRACLEINTANSQGRLSQILESLKAVSGTSSAISWSSLKC